MPAISLNVLITTLRDKGLCVEKANHFLRIELFNITYRDRTQLEDYVKKGLSEDDAMLKLLLVKKQRLYDELMSGHYDRRLAFY